MKYFVFSIDDGTIYDEKVIEIFNRHHISASFNLNSGLGDFVWYNEGRPVRRFNLETAKDLYRGHEIASHSLTHPHMTQCPGEIVAKEVGEDIDNLERVFEKEINTFAFPFEDSDERCISIIKYIRNIKVIRLSDIDRSFHFPEDPYHIRITSLDVNDALSILDDFIEKDDAELFVFVSHAYDFEFNDAYSRLDELCKRVSASEQIKVITMNQLASFYR